MVEHLIQISAELRSELKAAATLYAAVSPSEFENDTLLVTASKLRVVGLISTGTWVRVPAGGAVRVKREPSGLVAQVILPRQQPTGG